MLFFSSSSFKPSVLGLVGLGFFFFFFESILHFQFVVYFLSQFTVDVSAAANLFAGLS